MVRFWYAENKNRQGKQIRPGSNHFVVGRKKQGGEVMKCNYLCNFEYNEKYDAYFCRKHNEWKEKKCGDEKCSFCHDRPEKPVSK